MKRIAGNLHTDYVEVPQDGRLANNQADGIRCGDNGIFKGVPVTEEQKALCEIAKSVYHTYPSDGKYIHGRRKAHPLPEQCAHRASTCKEDVSSPPRSIPLGDWTGGTDVDTGATNRKLGSDMADSVTGGGLHGTRPVQSGCVGQYLRLAEGPGNGKARGAVPAPSGTIPWTAFPTRRSWRLPGDTSRPLAALRNLRNGGWCDEDNNGNAAGPDQPNWCPM